MGVINLNNSFHEIGALEIKDINLECLNSDVQTFLSVKC